MGILSLAASLFGCGSPRLRPVAPVDLQTIDLDGLATLAVPRAFAYQGQAHGHHTESRRVYLFANGSYRQTFSGVTMHPVTLTVSFYADAASVYADAASVERDTRPSPDELILANADPARRARVELQAPAGVYSQRQAAELVAVVLASIAVQPELDRVLAGARQAGEARRDRLALRRDAVLRVLQAEGIQALPFEGSVFGKSVAAQVWARGGELKLIRIVGSLPKSAIRRWDGWRPVLPLSLDSRRGVSLLSWNDGDQRWDRTDLDFDRPRPDLDGFWGEVAARLQRDRVYVAASEYFGLERMPEEPKVAEWLAYTATLGRGLDPFRF